jgi:prevent-host-death family protein
MFNQEFVTASEVRRDFAELLMRSRYEQMRFMITKRDRFVAALVTSEDFLALEELCKTSPAKKELQRQMDLEGWHRARQLTREGRPGCLIV